MAVENSSNGMAHIAWEELVNDLKSEQIFPSGWAVCPEE
jgi:hypothetical protein